MKKIITLSVLLIIFTANLFPQNIPAGIRPDPESKKDITKQVQINPVTPDNSVNNISPVLNLFINKIEKDGKMNVSVTDAEKGFNQVLSFYKNDFNAITLPVLIKALSVSDAKNIITLNNGVVQTVAGNIISAEVPVSSVINIAQSPSVEYIDASMISKVKINVSRVETKIDMIHSGTGLSRSYKGNGVVVGFVDSGIDWKHPDFHNAGGNRIKYLWDMSGSSNPPSGYNYGTEYTKAQLDANQCSEIDGNDGGGHGTHVSGTAAGNGSALPDYIGMAPLSDIIFVKGFRNSPGFSSTDVINGCSYIFQKASQLGEPAVINLSLGGHFGSHDGTSLYEQGLNNLTGNGKIIVAAAGNEGGETIHLSYTASGSSYNDAYESFMELENNASIAVADMWYSPGNISVGLAAYDVNLNLIGYTNGITPGQKIEDAPFTVNGTTYGYVTVDATGTNNPNNGDNEVVIVVDSHNGSINITNVFWSVYTYGTGTFDAWMATGGIFSTYSGTYYIPGDNNSTIGMPGTAGKLICVGAYCTKDHWVDIDGITEYQPGNPVIGQISWFSSLGPSRDGRIKPDIVAPGEAILAALSEDVTQVPRQNILLGGWHQKMQGTSMATPHVTGAIALLLEKNASLNYDQTVALLKNYSKHDAFTGNSPNNTYGYGKMDAYNSFVNASGGGGTQTVLIQEGFDGTFLPAGWTNIVTNSNHTWMQGNVQNHNFNTIDPNSTNSAICPWVAENQNEWLITPSFNLGSGSASIEFYAGFSTQYLGSATMNLKISTDGGSNWTQLWTAENDGQDWTWRQEIIDLSSYSNKQNLRLAWQYAGNDGDIVGVDGVKLTGFTSTGVEDNQNTQPTDYALYQNYPNPFNPTTMINYSLPKSGNVQLKVFNILSQEVMTLINDFNKAGLHSVQFNASGLASGIYFYKIQSGSFSSVKKMILIK